MIIKSHNNNKIYKNKSKYIIINLIKVFKIKIYIHHD